MSGLSAGVSDLRGVESPEKQAAAYIDVPRRYGSAGSREPTGSASQARSSISHAAS